MGRLLREKYVRQPTPFCAGCGHGVFMNAFLHAVDEVGLDFKNTVFVSGIPRPRRRLRHWGQDDTA
jgi:pyruvate/2-oxoacid:ferredoxin oxidoreductase beta subunit